jgi:hypothetical protein
MTSVLVSTKAGSDPIGKDVLDRLREVSDDVHADHCAFSCAPERSEASLSISNRPVVNRPGCGHPAGDSVARPCDGRSVRRLLRSPLVINGLFEQALEQLVELMKDALEDRSDGSTSLVAGLHLERSL